MNTQQAIEFINQVHDSDYSEDELEIVHVALVQAIGSKIEAILNADANLFEAMSAYMLTPEGKFLETAVRNAHISEDQISTA